MPLVADQPVAPAPVAKVHRARQVRHRLCRIGNIAGAAGRRLVETKAAFWADIDGRQRRRAAAGTGERPEIGRASRRERVGPYVLVTGVDSTLKKKKEQTQRTRKRKE